MHEMHAGGPDFGVARSELVLGGQKSGKSRRAEMLAGAWLDAAPEHRAVLIATAEPYDAEMRERIRRHQQDRALRIPALVTVEEPLALAQAIMRHGAHGTLVVVDCLTLWLTHLRMPPPGRDAAADGGAAAVQALLEAIDNSPGPLVLVGHEIGLGVIPLGSEVRAFVDALGRLNQAVAARCDRVTLMAAGLPLRLKDTPC